MAKTKRIFKLSDYERISQPNNQTLAELTKKAIGSRTLAEFASLCGVSTSTIFRVVNAQIKSPLSDALIVDIAKYADPQSGVTQEMMIAAHGLSKIESSQKKGFASTDAGSTAMYIENLYINLIRNYLMDGGYSILKYQREANAHFDFSIETNALTECGIDVWHFETVYTNNEALKPSRIYDKLSRLFEYCYFNNPRQSKEKLSLVIDSKKAFDSIKSKYASTPVNDVISIIHIDIVNQKIVEEFQLPLATDDFKKKIF